MVGGKGGAVFEQLSRDFGGSFGTLDTWSEGMEELSSRRTTDIRACYRAVESEGREELPSTSQVRRCPLENHADYGRRRGWINELRDVV